MDVLAKINELQGIRTEQLNMFNLHELYIDAIHVAYIRIHSEKIEVLPVFKFAPAPCLQYKITMEKLKDMVERFRSSNCFYL
ncbi:hypothetical protein [Paenibacillus chitinolyticus]|uniref:hypothetical protein n=1 Tax=Paenibacillus chitinolyticus TaxID=79263 RepID=UPI00366F66E2